MAKNNIRNAYGQLEKQIDDSGSLPAANKEALKKFIKGMISILDKTIDSGKFDGGGAVSLADSKVRACLAELWPMARRLKKEVKELVASLGTGPEIPKFEFNYAKHQNVNLHKVSIPIKSDDRQVKKIFGGELKLVVGTGDKAFFLALDPDGDTVIKSALDRLAAKKAVKVIPGEMILQAGQVMAFAQSVAPNPIIESVATMLEQAEGKDKIKVTTTPVTRACSIRSVSTKAFSKPSVPPSRPAKAEAQASEVPKAH